MAPERGPQRPGDDTAAASPSAHAAGENALPDPMLNIGVGSTGSATPAPLEAPDEVAVASVEDEDPRIAVERRLREEILALNATVWEHRIGPGDLDRWLERLDATEDASALGDDDGSTRLHALYLLSQFLYFGDREVRALLRTLYEDLVRYPVVSQLRRALGDTRRQDRLEAGFQLALRATRFLGVGNPSESGPHLLYYFRQENGLPKEVFRNVYELLDRRDKQQPVLAEPPVAHYVFLDDFCGTGEQASDFYWQAVHDVREAAQAEGLDVRFSYLALAARTGGLARLRADSEFDNVDAVLKLDTSFAAFSPESRYFQPPLPVGISKAFAENLCFWHGTELWERHPLGYQGCALLLGFRHNTPDNTLPIFWFGEDGSGWFPIFRRYHKKG